MANIIVPSRKLYQPVNSLTTINWNNPITRSLVAAIPPELGGKDLASNETFEWYNNTIEPASTQYLVKEQQVPRVVSCSHDYMHFFNQYNPISNRDDFTILIWAKNFVGTGYPYNYSCFSRGSDGWGAGWSINICTSTNDSKTIIAQVVWTVPSTIGRSVSSSVSWNIGTWVLVRFMQDVSLSLFVKDNAPIHDTTSIGNTLRSSTRGIGSFGTITNAGNPNGWIPRNWYGYIGNIFVWNRALADPECTYILDNPWQIFKSSNNTKYFDIPTPAPAPTKDIGGLIHLNKTIGGL
jgi:hypothetical protein